MKLGNEHLEKDLMKASWQLIQILLLSAFCSVCFSAELSPFLGAVEEYPDSSPNKKSAPLGDTVFSPTLNSFNTGVITPHMESRIDYDKYNSCLRTAENVFVTPQGAVQRRQGTYYVAEGADTITITTYAHPESDPTKIHIYTAAQLQSITYDDDYPRSGDYELMNDIDCSSIDRWKPIGGGHPDYDGSNIFTGTFDGRYFTISNINIFYELPYFGNSVYTGYGLFGIVSNGWVKRVILTNVNVTAEHHATIPQLDRDITNCGLLVGFGGLGGGSGTFTDCYAQGTITATRGSVIATSGGFAGGRIGGLYGGADSVFLRCGAEVTIYGENGIILTGGFVGRCDGIGNRIFQDCYAIGTIVTSASGDRLNSVGGFVGESIYYTSGADETTTFTNCYSAVAITGTETYTPPAIGGFVGEIASGGDTDDEDFNACFWDNTKMLEGTIGGRVGDLYDCGNLPSTDDEGDLAEVTKSTTTLMQTQSTFTDASWDFTDVWQIDEGSDYPRHQWANDDWPGVITTTVYETDEIRLIPFEHSTGYAYVLELGNRIMRFYIDQ